MTSENEVKVLYQRMQELIEENKVLRSVNKFAGDERVTVRHSGYGPSIVIPIDDKKSAVLSNQRGQRMFQLPMEIFLEVKNTTPYFDMGYLYTDDELNNPNLILDIDEWVSSRTERTLKKSVEEITSPGTLNFLYNYTENKEDPKSLYLRDRLSKRMNEIMGVVMVEDTEE